MNKVKKFLRKPDNSIIDRGMDGAFDYIDSFSVEIDDSNQYSIDYLTARLFTSFPGWAGKLFELRNFLVKPFGLETGNIPNMDASDPSLHYTVGERAVFFTVIDRSESEIVMAEDDTHLYFRASVYIDKKPDGNPDTLYLTTLVKFHNIGGRLYFLPVKPFHKLIMIALLKRFSNL